MRTVVYKDKLIPNDQYKQLIKEYSNFLYENTGIKAKFWVKEYDYTDYPTNVDVDGDDVPRPTFLQDIADEVDSQYGDWGADHIVTLIHEDNWKSGATRRRKGISGTNYSYRYNNYHIQYVRWWNRPRESQAQELINRFGTLNHEQDHSYDALIKQEIGININPILGVSSYDRDTTHGGHPNYDYIQYKENAEKLRKLAPYLIAAYKKRKDRHTEHVKDLQWTIVGLLEKLVYYWTKRNNTKNGNPGGS